MKIFRNSTEFNISDIPPLDFSLSQALFFDIETTGFSAPHTSLYLIGCMYYDENLRRMSSVQWFMDDDDEASLLKSFFDFSKNYRYIIHFNGDGFDIPYMLRKCAMYNLTVDFSHLESIDLYKYAFNMRKILKLPNLKQKTIEDFLKIQREDRYSGKELIKIYEEYKKTFRDSELALLVLHNLNDIQGLAGLLTLLDYKNIFDGRFCISSVSVENNEAIVEAVPDRKLVSRISASDENYYMTAYGNTLKLRINIYTDELKFFYSNYKDYYYLPDEDISIHKSVAFYVDKNFRTRAKAANCYSKKTGRFLPQHAEVISPYFKIEYGDSITYFELTEDFLTDRESIKLYVTHVLNFLLKA